MNTKDIIVLLLSAVTLANCQEAHPVRFTVQIKDDAGTPLPKYPVHIGTLDRAASMKKNEEIWTDFARPTGVDGRVTFDTRSETGMIGINFIQGLPPGYYLTTIPNHQFDRVENGRWVPDNPLIEVVLKRKLKPIPMYVRRFGMGMKSNADIPELGKEFGFDLVVADWMPPHGKGRNADMYFTHTQKYDDPRNFVATLKVRFPGEDNGLVPAPRVPQQGSALRLDHNAPSDGYQSAFDFKTAALPPDNMIHTSVRDDMNYYVRTRTVKDAEGRIVSCNYGKIHGDFKFDVRETRRIYFTYYLNPTSNDRNVEFDPTRNLFQDLPLGEEVQDP